MKKQLGPKNYMYPLPVLIVGTYAEDGTPDAMNVAYGGILNAARLQINIGVRHKTSDNIKIKKEFTVGIADRRNLVPADYVGIVSGHDVEGKIAKAGWTVTKSEIVDAPVFEELPITLECRVEEINQYDKTLRIVAEIVGTLVDEDVLDDEDRVDAGKLQALCYDPATHEYRVMGEKAGQAFADGKALE